MKWKGIRMAEKKENNITLEDAFAQIEEIISTMESTDVSLEDSFVLYEQGMKKLKYCNDRIEKVEKKMLVLNSKGELDEF